MAEVLLFHHAHGLTPGVVSFADALRQAGHTVHTPDLYEGRTFAELQEGVGYAQEIGFDTVFDRGVRAADGLPERLVYAGWSLGVPPAQKLAMSRRGALGALLLAACLPPDALGGSWPSDVAVQIHGVEEDEFFAGDGDLDAARDLIAGVEDAELFLYPGDGHLIADESLPSYDEGAAGLLTGRVLAFLASCG